MSPGGVRSCSIVLSINSLSTTRAGNFSSSDNLQIIQLMNQSTATVSHTMADIFRRLKPDKLQHRKENSKIPDPSSSFQLHTLSHLFRNIRKKYVPWGRGACPYEQWSKDLSQCVCVQAIAGLHLGDLGQVCEEVLQGETVVEGDGSGALKDQAYLSVMAASDRTICNRDSNTHD